MVTGLILSLASAGCLGVGGGLLFVANRNIAQRRLIGASPDAERVWGITKFAGIVVVGISLVILIIALNNPHVSS